MADDERPRARRRPLLSTPSSGAVVAGILAGVEHLVANRPKPVAEIAERHRDPWNRAGGVTVDGLDEPIDRPEPPDRSGARI
jgi:hypothetical protein